MLLYEPWLSSRGNWGPATSFHSHLEILGRLAPQAVALVVSDETLPLPDASGRCVIVTGWPRLLPTDECCCSPGRPSYEFSEVVGELASIARLLCAPAQDSWMCGAFEKWSPLLSASGFAVVTSWVGSNGTESRAPFLWVILQLPRPPFHPDELPIPVPPFAFLPLCGLPPRR